MSTENETIADIICKKRERAKEIRANLSCVPVRHDDQIAEAEELEQDADRIEAAWKREKAEIEANALTVGAVVATTEKSSAVGNAAAMREALNAWLKAFDDFVAKPRNGKWTQNPCGTLVIPPISAARLVDMTNAALSTPARNCDVGTAEEQATRFGAMCNKYYNDEDKCDERCPLASMNFVHGFPRCQAYWAQMPYEADAEKGSVK